MFVSSFNKIAHKKTWAKVNWLTGLYLVRREWMTGEEGAEIWAVQLIITSSAA